MSNARYSAKNIYLAKADREISEIESGASVRDQAKKMRDNTIDPADTFAWLRDLLFVWNLGFSVTFVFEYDSAILQTIPMLSQYVNTGFATKHVLRGIELQARQWPQATHQRVMKLSTNVQYMRVLLTHKIPLC